MKKLFFLFLLFFCTLPAQAVTPINGFDFAVASQVASKIVWWCDCTKSIDANGAEYVSEIRAVYLRYTVESINYCIKTYGGSFFLMLMTPTDVNTSLLDGAGKSWVWSVGTNPPPKADSWCNQ